MKLKHNHYYIINTFECTIIVKILPDMGIKEDCITSTPIHIACEIIWYSNKESWFSTRKYVYIYPKSINELNIKEITEEEMMAKVI
jgi:hypothetical protein